MNVHPIAVTEDTVTLRRADFDALMSALEDADDVAVLTSAAARDDGLGKAAARADHLPVELVLRLASGEHPVTIWREKRGLSTIALADAAGVSRSYLTEIEGGRKPGSVAAYRALAGALGVAIDHLVPAPRDATT